MADDFGVTDEEVIRIMLDGGRKLCDYAMGQWTGNKYQMSHEECLYNYQRWRHIRDRMKIVADSLRSHA